MLEPPVSSPIRPPITDSPWFWLLVFSAAGMVALVLISSRYQPRQRRLEMQYMAREEILRRQAEGEPVARELGQEGDAPPPGAGELIVPLWPLFTTCGAVLLASTAMLWRARRGLTAAESQPSGGKS